MRLVATMLAGPVTSRQRQARPPKVWLTRELAGEVIVKKDLKPLLASPATRRLQLEKLEASPVAAQRLRVGSSHS